MPPPEGEQAVNQPPFIDWSLTYPEADEFGRSRNANAQLEFRIDGAFYDPDGDQIDIVWYWIADKGAPTVWFGDETMTLDPCELRTLAEAATVWVHVLVSDGVMSWTGEPGVPFPVDVDDDSFVVKRMWTVSLTGECPP